MKMRLGELDTLSVEGSPAAEVPIEFQGADSEVHFSYIRIYDEGSLRAVLQNRWDNGASNGGYFSLLHHARGLEIQNSPQTVRDLVAYVNGVYPLGERWQWQELGRDVKIMISSTETEQQLVRALMAHFTKVVLRNVQMGSIVWTSMMEQNNSVWGDKQNVFTGCRNVPPGKFGTLSVYGSPVAEVPVEFRDADGEVHIPCIRIYDKGSLRAVLHNCWDNGMGGGGHYSLLHYARELEIQDNPQALCDLLAYAEGKYPLDGRWQRQTLESLSIEVHCSTGELPAVEQLGQYTRGVTVYELKAPLGVDSTVTVDCFLCAFTESRAMEPQSLLVDADVKHGGIDFLDADSEVHIPDITIGPRGSLRTVVRNRWQNGGGGNGRKNGYYSLLWHAETLMIRGNTQAVRDLAAYVAGRHEMGIPWWPVRSLSKGLRLAIVGVTGCEAEIGALAEHLGVICVDGRKVLSEMRRRMLADCDGRERSLRPLRSETVGRQLALGETKSLLVEKQQEVQRARLRLREMEGRLAALVTSVW